MAFLPLLMKGAGPKSVYEMARSVCQIALSALQSGDNGGGWYVIFPAGDTEHRHQEGAGMFTCAFTGLRPAEWLKHHHSTPECSSAARRVLPSLAWR